MLQTSIVNPHYDICKVDFYHSSKYCGFEEFYVTVKRRYGNMQYSPPSRQCLSRPLSSSWRWRQQCRMSCGGSRKPEYRNNYVLHQAPTLVTRLAKQNVSVISWGFWLISQIFGPTFRVVYFAQTQNSKNVNWCCRILNFQLNCSFLAFGFLLLRLS